MDNFSLYLTLWIASGAFIGGVFTPLLTSTRQFNDWLAALIGTVAGAFGNLIALVPLWAILWTRSAGSTDTRQPWQRDAVAAGVAEREAAQDSGIPAGEVLAFLHANFWPQPRTEGHSHRLHYVGVAAALAVLTAVEVALTFGDGAWVTGTLIMLSTLKVLLVVGFFMHLIYDSKWYAALFAFTFPFALMVPIVLALA